jgi:sigma-B regulation protein RsbU (phosphoserine phosphatase)
MTLYSILLIENQISIAAALAEAVSHSLTHYRLIITPELANALAEPEPAQVILLNIAQLAEDVCPKLSNLSAAYQDVPIILLHNGQQPTAEENQKLLATLAWGAATYVPLSKDGLIALGKQLAAQQSAWQAQQAESELGLTANELLYQAIISDTSQLAIQIIGPDNRIRAWNRAAETLFGLNKQAFRAPLIESLALSPANLDRLKDFLDQTRSTGEPLFIPNFSLDSQHGDTHWVQLHLYPIYAEVANQPEGQLIEICIISADITDIKQSEVQTWQYSQELQVLLETSRQVSGRLELLPTLEKIVEQTKTLLNADNGRIYFLEKGQNILQPILSIGPLPEQDYPTAIPLDQGPIGTVARSGQAAMFDTPDQSGQVVEHLLCVPLTAFKEMMGVIAIGRLNKSPFINDDLRFLESIVRQISAAIYNSRRFEETRNNLNELAILYETNSAIASARDIETVLKILIRQMVQVLNVNSGHIVSWNKAQNTGTVQADFWKNGMAPDGQTASPGSTFDLAQRPWLLALRNQQPVVLQSSDPDLAETERREMAERDYRSRLLVPLVVKDEAIGWAELWETRQERYFSGDDIRLARLLANQAAVALENLQYIKQTRQALEETDALYQVASALATTQDAQTIISTVLQEYLRALDLRQGSVIIFDFEAKVGVVKVNFQDEYPAQHIPLPTEEAYVEGRPAQGREGWQLPLRNNPLYERLMATHQPIVIDDTQGKSLPFLPKAVPPLPALIRLGWAGPETLSLLIVPIQMRGEIAGVLVAEATQHRHVFTPGEIALGQAMADQLGIGLQNVELFEAEYRRRQQAETLREVSFVVGSSLNLNEVLERILDQLARVIKYDSAAIHLIEGKRRRIIAGRGFPNPKKVIGMTFPVILENDRDPSTIAIQARQPMVVSNVPASYNIFKKSSQDQIKSWMGIPLISRDKVIGLISINHTEANAYDEEDLGLALAFANQVAIALENARLYEIEVRELERELEIAQSIQETLLPQLVPQVPGLEISGRILPARHIGGDFFHFFPAGKDQLGVAIGDVSGKGIPAALYMAVAITAIDAQIRADVGPGELLNKLNHILYNRLRENKMNVALQVATFAPLSADTNDSEQKPQGVLMTVASAGMIAPVGATEHGCHFLPVSGLPVGALSPPEQNYHDDTFLLDPFTTIIFTSDGIVEAQNEARELFGFERLEAAINEVIAVRDAEVIAEHIINTAQNFIGQAEQNDDMTVVVVIKK